MMIPVIKHYAVFTLLTLAGVFFALGSIIFILLKWEYPPAYIVLNPESKESHYARQIGPNWITIGREFEITRDVQLRINRELVLKNYEPGKNINYWQRKELETTIATYHPGRYKTERDLRLPFVPSGNYTIVNVVCWPINFIREQCVDLPDVTITIVNTER